MIIAIDIGNTNIVMGIIKDDKILLIQRFATDRQRTEDEYAVLLKNILDLHCIEPSGINGGIISSVVPSLTNILKRTIQITLGIVPLVVGPGVKTGLNILIDNPKQLGSDIVVDAIAAMHEYKGPLIILDMGTATTISAVDGKGNYLGRVIIPGLKISHDALTGRTAQLPYISLEAPPCAIGKNTIEAMQSGLIFGHAALLDGMIDRVQKELNGTATIIATGGLAPLIIPYCNHHIIYDDTLLIKGMLLIYKKNIKE